MTLINEVRVEKYEARLAMDTCKLSLNLTPACKPLDQIKAYRAAIKLYQEF